MTSRDTKPAPTIADAIESAGKAMQAAAVGSKRMRRDPLEPLTGGAGLRAAWFRQELRYRKEAAEALLVAVSDRSIHGDGRSWSSFGSHGLDVQGVRDRVSEITKALDLAAGLLGGGTLTNAEPLRLAFGDVLFLDPADLAHSAPHVPAPGRIAAVPLSTLIGGTSWRVKEAEPSPELVGSVKSRARELVDAAFGMDGHPTGAPMGRPPIDDTMTPAEHGAMVEQEDAARERESWAAEAPREIPEDTGFIDEQEDPDADGAGVSFNPAAALADVEDTTNEGDAR